MLFFYILYFNNYKPKILIKILKIATMTTIRNLIGVLSLLYVINIVSAQINPYMTLEWRYLAREAINDIHISDLNGDGKREIIAASYDNHIHLISHNGSKIWKYNAKCAVFSVYAGDIDNDGCDEILAGSCRPVHIFDYNMNLKSKFVTKDDVKKIITADFDLDDKLDIIAVSGSMRDHTIYIFNDNFDILWQKSFRGDFPWGIAISDLDGDGKKEVIVGSSYLMVYDNEGRLRWKFDTNTIYDLIVDDIDMDGGEEIIVGTHPTLYVITNDGNLKWKFNTFGTIKSVHISDLEGDGEKEIIVGSDKLYLLDSKGNLIWDFDTNSSVNKVTSGDLDWDSIEEIVSGSKKIHVIDKSKEVEFEYSPYREVSDIEISDLDDDGKNELISAGKDFTVYCFKAREIYINQKRFYEFYERGKNLFDKGDYENARIELEKAINITKLPNTGISPDDINDCHSMLNKINSIISTSTSTLQTTLSTTPTTSSLLTTTTLEETRGFPVIYGVIFGVMIIIVAAILMKKR